MNIQVNSPLPNGDYDRQSSVRYVNQMNTVDQEGSNHKFLQRFRVHYKEINPKKTFSRFHVFVFLRKFLSKFIGSEKSRRKR